MTFWFVDIDSIMDGLREPLWEWSNGDALEAARKEIDRLRQALEFYADHRNWAYKTDDRVSEVAVEQWQFTEMDKGKRAREALKA